MIIEKPPYRVPLMSEIVALPKNGYKAISTFSGCGGSSLGYKMAGFDLLWANEFIPAAQESYRANHPDTILDTRDIRTIQPEEILAAIGMQKGELDLFDGSPPCASFSTAGIREKGWGKTKKYSDTEQRTDDLFFEFARLVKGIQPKVFVAENVKGLTIGTAKAVLGDAQTDLFNDQADTIYHTLCDCGYVVRHEVLNAKHLGVPQSRQRVIFIGIRKDLAQKFNLEPVYPKNLPYIYSVRDALPHIVKLRHVSMGQEGTREFDVASEPMCTVRTPQGGANTRVEVEETIVGVGANGPFGEAVFKSPDEPAATIGASPNSGNGLGGRGDVLVQKVAFRAVHDTSGKGNAEPQGSAASYSAGDITDRPCPAITVGVNSLNSSHYKIEEMVVEKETDISRFAIGAEWDKLKPGEQSEKYFSLVKVDPEGRCPTVCASHGGGSIASITHPTEKRKFTIAELRRICGFPDDFILKGTYQQQWERLGRAVPPVMLSHVARVIRDEILGKMK